ncbi:MAG: hypothetical protein JRH20_31315, partial [Deltaproteobacteria bacterium]|nr:hypothetical protein [Deltaproteobacteria bacterium]
MRCRGARLAPVAALSLSLLALACGGPAEERSVQSHRAAAQAPVIGTAQLLGAGPVDSVAVQGDNVWLSAREELNHGVATGTSTRFAGWERVWSVSEDRPALVAVGQVLVAAALRGDGFVVYRSADGGEGFTSQTHALPFDALGVSVSATERGEVLIVVGEKMPNTGPTMLAAIWGLKSDDAGKTFGIPVEIFRVNGSSAPMIWPNSLDAGANSEGFYVGYKVLYSGAPANQFQVATSVGGKNWTSTTLRSSRYLRGADLLVTADGVYATGADGYAPYNAQVYFWRFDGATWHQHTLYKGQATATLASNGSRRVFALLHGSGDEGTRLLATSDEGVSWQEQGALSAPTTQAMPELVSGAGRLFVLWSAYGSPAPVWHWQTISAPLPCGTAALFMLRPSATGHEQRVPMTCGPDGRWRAQVAPLSSTSPSVSIRFETTDQQTFGDNRGDYGLDAGGDNISFVGEREVIVDFARKNYWLYDPSHPCGAATFSLAWIGDQGFPGAVGSPMVCGSDGRFALGGHVSGSVREFYFMDQQTTSIPGVHVWGDTNDDGLIDLNGEGISSYEPAALGAPLEVRVDLRTMRYTVEIQTPIRRTVVFVFGETRPGQDMFIRGGIDHEVGNQNGRNCSTSNYA